jgi:alpha-beta hydrolase superfamily lysophospholipase
VPLHLVGYSNGGALAMKYALDALDAPALRKPQQVILLSPMIGVTAFARFAGFAGLPALLPAFAKAAWLNISPEYNPYKYNSFPVNAARQSWLLTKALQEQIGREARENRLANLPPVLAFQSVMDSTVSTRAVVTGLFDQLPANGSELVVFDINQAASFRPLFKPSSWTATSALLPVAQRRYSVTIITNASEHSFSTVAKITPAGSTQRRSCRLRSPGRRMSIPCRTLRCRSRRMTISMAVSLREKPLRHQPGDDCALGRNVRVERRERGAYAGHLEPVLRLYAGEDQQPNRG